MNAGFCQRLIRENLHLAVFQSCSVVRRYRAQPVGATMLAHPVSQQSVVGRVHNHKQRQYRAPAPFCETREVCHLAI